LKSPPAIIQAQRQLYLKNWWNMAILHHQRARSTAARTVAADPAMGVTSAAFVWTFFGPQTPAAMNKGALGASRHG